MKKSKFLLMTLVLIVLLGFSLFFVPAKVKANDITETWGAPEAAKNFMDKDGKGIRLYVNEVFADDNGFITHVYMTAIKEYQFSDGSVLDTMDYTYGRGWFDSDLLDGYLADYIDRWGSGNTIPDWDRTYVYFTKDGVPEGHPGVFSFEYHGTNYAGYMLEQYLTLYEDLGYDIVYDYGYDVGYNVGFNYGYGEGYDDGYVIGYDEGYEKGFLEGDYSEVYQEGFKAGQKSKLAENNEKFYSGIEKWLVPAIITVILLGGFVSIAVRKRREE